MKARVSRKTARALEGLAKAMVEAPSYAAWQEGAVEHDGLSGMAAWREEPASPDYDWQLIEARVRLLRRLQKKRDTGRLEFYLREELHGNLGNMANPKLYDHALAGTKTLITDYLDEVVAALELLCKHEAESFGNTSKRRFFKRAARGFGRSALLLSGGATLGLFHLGVIKALWSEGLLPTVISGSSAGSIMAAIVGCHTDDELEQIFDPGYVRMEAWHDFGLGNLFEGRGIGDIDSLRRAINRNVPKLTFMEAYERTGRIINIPVSPVDPNQFPRLMNYLSAPNVYVRRAALASCAIPGIFPAVTLRAKSFEGEDVPYSAESQWLDGSLKMDVPKLRVARMHNVNHFIVSQTNPLVIPFLSDREPHGLLPFTWELIKSTARVNTEHFLDQIRRQVDSPALAMLLDKFHSVATQSYSGDINLFPSHQASNIAKTFADPTPRHVADFIEDGERATWPKIERIRNTTRISRHFETCLIRLAEEEEGARR